MIKVLILERERLIDFVDEKGLTKDSKKTYNMNMKMKFIFIFFVYLVRNEERGWKAREFIKQNSEIWC